VNKVVFLEGRHSQNDISERRSVFVDRLNSFSNDRLFSLFSTYTNESENEQRKFLKLNKEKRR